MMLDQCWIHNICGGRLAVSTSKIVDIPRSQPEADGSSVQDSTVMKLISSLIMVFLPASFAAVNLPFG